MSRDDELRAAAGKAHEFAWDCDVVPLSVVLALLTRTEAAPVVDGAVAWISRVGLSELKEAVGQLPVDVYPSADRNDGEHQARIPLFTHPQDATAKDVEIAMLRETLQKIDDRLIYGMDRAGSSLERKRTMCDSVAFARAALALAGMKLLEVE